jgi:hypothetical protein
MNADEDADFSFGMGGPGEEDFANGAAALAAAMVREAQALAVTAAALRNAAAVMPGDPSGGPLSDIRRQRVALAAAGDAAMKAALLLEAADLTGAGGDTAVLAERIATAARRGGTLPGVLVPPLPLAPMTAPPASPLPPLPNPWPNCSAEPVRRLSWVSTAVSSVCPMSANPRCSMR